MVTNFALKKMLTIIINEMRKNSSKFSLQKKKAAWLTAKIVTRKGTRSALNA